MNKEIIKELINYAKKNNFDDFIILFKKAIEKHNPIHVLKEINKNVNFIDQRPKKNSASKNDFLIKLDAFLREQGIKNNLLKTINFFENGYAEILKERDIIKGDLSSEYLIASIIMGSMISNHNLNIHLNHILNHSTHFHEKIYLSAGPLGENIDPDDQRNALSKVLTSTIHIESYTNDWFDKKNGITILPQDILNILQHFNLSEKSHLSLMEKLPINIGLWDILEEIDFHFRLLKEDLYFKDHKSIHISTTNDSKFLTYAIIANERMGRARYNITIDNKDNSLIELEKIIFQILLHIDVDNDQTQYDGLTIAEWISAFYTLRTVILQDHFNLQSLILNDDELITILSKNINKEKCKIVIDHLSFKKGTPDIFNTPIIRFEGNKNLLVPIALQHPNMLNIIHSILSKKELALNDKGTNFEKEFLLYFKRLESKYGFTCSNPSKRIKGEEFQFDMILEWDNFIFIFECKNRSIPNTHPISLANFKEKANEYTKQIHRLQEGLISYSDQFSIDISSKIVVPIIVNSLSFSLDFKINGVIFTDFSIISKFFSQRYFTKNRKKGSKIKKEKIYDQWRQISPSPTRFLHVISNPYQVSEAKRRLRHFKTEHKLLDYNLVIDRSIVRA